MTKQEIFDFMNGRSARDAFVDKAHNSIYSWTEFLEVHNEIEVLKRQIFVYMNDSPTTKTALIADLTSDLDVEKVVDKIMNGQTWTNFKASFNESL